jgi:peptidoglycan/LPS O-acetylase OafA/YrhL
MTKGNILAENSSAQAPMKLDGALSSYLDFLRFFAALAVLLAHMEQDGLYLSWFPMTYFSHEAVIVFFVMSGLIIYSTTASAHREPTNYIIARVSRVYSVALPAIIFSVLAASLVPADIFVAKEQISNYRPVAWWDMISSALFLNESWMNSAKLTMNAPYWSLCYEVWYYLLFGVYFFVGGRLRWVLLAGLACIAGPAILVLFPIWIVGAWVASGQRFGSLAWSKTEP